MVLRACLCSVLVPIVEVHKHGHEGGLGLSLRVSLLLHLLVLRVLL